jgi:hypothetical protein
MRRSSRMASEATSRVPVVTHRPAATPKVALRDWPPMPAAPCAASPCRCRARLGPGDRRRGHTHAKPAATRAGRWCARVGARLAGRVARLSRRSRVAAAPGRVRTRAALAWVDERVGHSAAEPTAQERRGPAAGAGGEGPAARAARAPSLRAAPQGHAHRASRGLHPVSLRGPRLRRGPLPLPGEGHDLVPAQLSALLRAARPWERGTSSSRSAQGRATARPWRGRWWVRRDWSLPSTSTPQRSTSPGRTWNGRPTPTLSSFTATGDSGTPSTPRTTGSASRRPAPMSHRPLIEQLAVRGQA